MTPRSATSSGVIRGFVGDLARSRAELLAENAFLRQQLLVASRQNKRPHLRRSDRTVLVLLASLLSHWRQLLVLVRPETLLRWHRDLFRRWWRFRSHRPRRGPPRRLPADTAALIRRMATDNHLWGAERIRGELLKVGIHVCKRTIQRYIAGLRSSPPTGQKWTTFLRNHLAQMWACDFVEVRDLWFHGHYVFVAIHLGSRRVLAAVTTSAPTITWTAQQLRNLTLDGIGPRLLLRDRDGKYGDAFDAVARAVGTTVIKTPVRAPEANAFVERFIGSLRRECLDHCLILDEHHQQRIRGEYRYFNRARPHQGLRQRRPDGPALDINRPMHQLAGEVAARPVLGGLHHDYHRAH